MSAGGHTPGPWRVSGKCPSGSGWNIRDADGNVPAVARTYNDESGAHARLIAAAPGLLEAARTTESVLSTMLEFWERNGFGTIYADSITIERDRLRAMIRAADGAA